MQRHPEIFGENSLEEMIHVGNNEKAWRER